MDDRGEETGNGVGMLLGTGVEELVDGGVLTGGDE